MLRKAFFGASIPQIKYEALPVAMPEPDHVPASKTMVLLHPKSDKHNVPTLFRPGDDVNAGQKISLFADDPAYEIGRAHV